MDEILDYLLYMYIYICNLYVQYDTELRILNMCRFM